MSSVLLPLDLRKFISEQGYDFKDSGQKKVIKSKPGISVFQTVMFVILGLLLCAFGFMFELLYVLGVLVMLVPLVKYILRKRYVYEFDLKRGIFEIKDFLSPGKRTMFSFGDILDIEINHYTSNTEVSGFSDSNKAYNYEVVVKIRNKQEYELFYFTVRELNPQDKVVAIRSTIQTWLRPALA